MNNLKRFITIYRVAARYRLYDLLDGKKGKFAGFLLKLPVVSRSASKGKNRGQRLRLALESLGPVFIKFGQLLSTRRDLVPEDIADELTYLQDQVPPFPGDQATALIEQALEDDIDALFLDFSREPLASASIAQVHTARLHTGEEVAIKVIRPGVDKVIEQDIALLHVLARLVENHVPGGKRLRAIEVVKDYELVIRDELNLQIEAANSSQLARNFENNEALYVPRIYWDYCRENVLVMERIYGIPINRKEELIAAGINLEKLAETGVEIFFTQVFNHSYFHADMHPGNIFVSRQHLVKPQYIALDCAIIGTLSKADQQYLARNLLAIFKRDYRKVAELHVQSGWVPADTPVHAFEATMRSVCEPIFEKPLGEISFGMLLLQLFRTASRFNMEVQPSLVLLQKTLLHIEGLGKQLYPELDLWQTALPFLEEWQKKRLSPFSNLKKIQEKFPEWLEQLPEMPELIHETITETRNDMRQQQELLKKQQDAKVVEQHQLRKRRVLLALVLLAGALLALQPDIARWLESVSTTVIVLGISAIFLLIWPFAR